LGFTVYEAKTYVSLLQNSPVTRYELSKHSGVPRSAIYGVIKQLENMGAVNALYSKPEKYVPLPPEQLFKLLEDRLKSKIADARQSLSGIESNLMADHLWNIVGYDSMIQKAKELIDNANSNILISVWKREFELLKNHLSDAIERGVHITVFSFNNIELDTEYLYSYKLPEEELQKIWDHKIILVADGQELLMGEADIQLPKKTAWTTNRAIVDIATNHIILDITLFGLRFSVDVSEAVTTMQNHESDYVGELMHQLYPNNPFMNIENIGKELDKLTSEN
jgi:sugar-specific transcriptional regulator TrmB